jgi:hypothetical protein
MGNKDVVSPKQEAKELKIVPMKKFDPSALTVGSFKTDSIQPMAFLTYGKREEQIILQTGTFQITDRGIPSLAKSDQKDAIGPKTDEERMYLSFGLDSDQKTTQEIREKFDELDNIFGSKEMKKKLFGAEAEKYEYQALIREPNEREWKDKEGNTRIKQDYVKAKFSVDFQTKALNVVLFEKMEDRSKMTPFIPSTVTEIADRVRFHSNIRLLLSLSKLWATKSGFMGKKRLYGLGLKIYQIEHDVPKMGKAVLGTKIGFIDNEDDDEPEEKVVSKKSEKKSSKTAKMSDNEDEAQNDEPEEEEEETKPKKKKSSSKNVDSNDESDSSSRKVSKKQSKPSSDVEDEPAEDEEEEEKPKKKKSSSRSK